MQAAAHPQQIQTARGGEALGYYDDGQRILTFKDGMVGGYCAYIGLDLDARWPWWCCRTNLAGTKSRPLRCSPFVRPMEAVFRLIF
jgi:hypothetical protein